LPFGFLPCFVSCLVSRIEKKEKHSIKMAYVKAVSLSRWNEHVGNGRRRGRQSKSQLSDPSNYLGTKELLLWVNEMLQLNVTKVEVWVVCGG
jgi:hypothetical protein